MGKTSLAISLIGLGIAAVGIPITLDQLGIMDLGGEKSDISLNLSPANDDFASFTLSNSEGGIAFVDKIELITDNFESSPECLPSVVVHQSTPTLTFDLTEIKKEPAIYPLEKLHNMDGVVGSAEVSTGLHYNKDDVDSFRAYFVVVDSDGNRVSETVSFDVKIRISWCDLNDCNRQSLESETEKAGYVGLCETDENEIPDELIANNMRIAP